MTVMTRRMLGAGAVALVFAASIAAAQTPPLRIRGTIENVDGQNLAVKARDGSMMKVKLADSPRVLTLNKMTLADVKQGTFVGITAMPQPDGSQKAVEIHIFPEPMRGTGEGHYAWDLMRRQPRSAYTGCKARRKPAISAPPTSSRCGAFPR